MADAKMHPDEVDTTTAMVRRLLREQFPQWASLPVRRVESSGTDNAMFRVGAEVCVRLPRTRGAVGALLREQRWLPVLAPHLPLTVPVPIGVGAPNEAYAHPWSVLPWIAGEPGTRDRLTDPIAVAEDLAKFIRALQAVDAADAPMPGPGSRGVPITARDKEVRKYVAELGSEVDAKAVLKLWDRVMDTPAWDGDLVWVHTDLHGGNILTRTGRLTAVIDFAPRIGDPAVALLPAWNLFDGEARDVFRAAVGVDDHTWERGRGWALSVALAALPYYLRLGTNPRIVADSRHEIAALLASV